jgi:type VI secretion system protein
MGLELRIIKDPCRDVPKPRVRAFGEQGGDVGRAPDSYWVLPDPKGYVSAQHFSVEYREGSFWLRDTSRNGVYLNGSRDPVGRGNVVPLHHGDRIRLAEYEVLVRLYQRHPDSALVLGETRADAGLSASPASVSHATVSSESTGEHASGGQEFTTDAAKEGSGDTDKHPYVTEGLNGIPVLAPDATVIVAQPGQEAPRQIWDGGPAVDQAAAPSTTDSDDRATLSAARALVEGTVDRLRQGWRM